jgi:hypothetical protein
LRYEATDAERPSRSAGPFSTAKKETTAAAMTRKAGLKSLAVRLLRKERAADRGGEVTVDRESQYVTVATIVSV